MKKHIALVIFLVLACASAKAQSSMTDDQVLRFVLKEHEAGTSQQQIVTRLMQRGVDINQIRRVKEQAKRLRQSQGLGTVAGNTATATDNRTRKNNATAVKADEQLYDAQYRSKDLSGYRHTYDENDPEFIDMQSEMGYLMPADTATMYQQLVDRLAKEKRKVFGRDIFNNRELTFEPNMNIATPRNYRLGPGDAVFVDIFGASQKSLQSTVSPDGTITIEGFGPVNVAGMTVAEANAHLRSQLGARYQSSNIKLTVGQTRTITVNVYGEVKTPGTYTLSAFATPLNALYMAGGISDLGTLRDIKVYRNNQLIAVIDVYDFILNGRTTNLRLTDNDVIYVGAYDCLVNISGKVKRPMFYEMKKNESVATLLKYSGGFTGDAYKKSVRLIRKTGREFSIYNVGEFDMASFHMADGDSVSVDSIIQRFDNMVELKGAVFRPGMYQVGDDINSVRTLLEAAEGVTEQAFLAHAVMHRMRADRTLEVVAVDVEGILSGRVPDEPLKPNDVLFIPTKQEMMQEQTITIHGEVYYPGIYKYAAGETLEDFVLQAGGLKETASTVKVDVARRITNPAATTTDSLVARTFSFALKDGFVIDGTPGFELLPFDEVYVRKSPGTYSQQNVVADGEVMFAGTYALENRPSRLSDLIKAAGGVTDRAYVKGAHIERRYNEEERQHAIDIREKAIEQAEINLQEQIAKSGNANLANLASSQQLKKYNISETYPVGIELDKALKNPGSSYDIVLREGDRLIVPEYNGTVKVNGEVMYANTVAYREGKSVNYYIDQAGGFTSKAKKSQTYIVYMNGNVAKVGHNAKVSPGCEIVVPAKPIANMSISQTLSIATSVGSLAAIIATLANVLK